MSETSDPPTPRRGRGIELALLLFAVAISVAAYVSVDIGALRRTYPEVDWLRFEDWAAARPWATPP